MSKIGKNNRTYKLTLFQVSMKKLKKRKSPFDTPILKHKKFKDQILDLLKTPLTATDIKLMMPNVSSTGTIAYHLNNLKKEGRVIRDKQEHVRGQPTYFYLKHLKDKGYSNWYELEADIKKELLKKKIRLFELLNKSPVDAFELEKKITGSDEDDEIVEMVFNHPEHIKLMAELTMEGKKFLEDNKKEDNK